MAKKDRDGLDATDSRRSAEFNANIGTDDAAAYLEALAEALRKNRLVVQTGSETLDVPVPPRVGLELEARSSRGARKASLELRLRWSESPALTISSGATADDDDDMETASSEIHGSPPAAENAGESRDVAEGASPPIWTSGAE